MHRHDTAAAAASSSSATSPHGHQQAPWAPRSSPGRSNGDGFSGQILGPRRPRAQGHHDSAHRSSSSSGPDTDADLSNALASTSLNSPLTQRQISWDKPLPDLPLARTPSQIQHQRQHQLPYRWRPSMFREGASDWSSTAAGQARHPSMPPMPTRQSMPVLSEHTALDSRPMQNAMTMPQAEPARPPDRNDFAMPIPQVGPARPLSASHTFMPSSHSFTSYEVGKVYPSASARPMPSPERVTSHHPSILQPAVSTARHDSHGARASLDPRTYSAAQPLPDAQASASAGAESKPSHASSAAPSSPPRQRTPGPPLPPRLPLSLSSDALPPSYETLFATSSPPVSTSQSPSQPSAKPAAVERPSEAQSLPQEGPEQVTWAEKPPRRSSPPMATAAAATSASARQGEKQKTQDSARTEQKQKSNPSAASSSSPSTSKSSTAAPRASASVTPSRAAGPSTSRLRTQAKTPTPSAAASTSSPSTSARKSSSVATPSSASKAPARTVPKPPTSSRSTPQGASKQFTTSATERPVKGQCWGVKRDGDRCTRSVKDQRGQSPVQIRTRSNVPGDPSTTPTKSTNPRSRQASAPPSTTGRSKNAAIVVDSDSDSDFEPDSDEDVEEGEGRDGALEPIYCHQHAREINKTAGFYCGKRYIAYDKYISSALPVQTQARLRTAMSQPLSAADADERGYIYVYEVMGRKDASNAICLKVGRSVNPMGRMASWRGQCASKEVLLRSVHPSPVAGNGEAQSGLLVGADAIPTNAGVVGSHRWEKLIHLELGEHRDLQADGSGSGSGSGKCKDCGKAHREIFLIPKASGGYGNVKDVVEKWRSFVEVVGKVEAAKGGSGG